MPAAVAKATKLGARVEAGPETTAYGLAYARLTDARLTDARGIHFLLCCPLPRG